MEAKKYKSFRYTNNLTWDKARRGNTSAPGKPQMEIGSPPEFPDAHVHLARAKQGRAIRRL